MGVLKIESWAGSVIAPEEASCWRVEAGVGIGFEDGVGSSETEVTVGEVGVGTGAGAGACWFLPLPLPLVSFALTNSGSTGDSFSSVFSKASPLDLRSSGTGATSAGPGDVGRLAAGVDPPPALWIVRSFFCFLFLPMMGPISSTLGSTLTAADSNSDFSFSL